MLNLKRFVSYIVIALLLMAIQGTLRVFVSTAPYLVPNLIIALLVWLAFTHPNVRGVIIAFIIGILFDLNSGAILGPWSFALVILFYILARLSPGLFITSSYTVIFCTFLASIVINALVLALSFSAKSGITINIFDILLASLTTALCTPILFRLFRKVIVSLNLLESDY
jgi:rod shape-determining protein MreD